jgi:putative serine protease PepD
MGSASATTDTASILPLMSSDDRLDDDVPVFRPLLPQEDRLWRHPSELDDPEITDARGPRWLRWHRPWVIVLVSGLVGALAATGAGVVGERLTSHSNASPVVERVVERLVEPVAPPGADVRDQIVAVSERVRPAIVQIKTTGVASNPIDHSGSGIILRDDGYVVTSARIVERATRIWAVLSDGRQVSAKLRGSDPDTDIAVVKLDGGPYPAAVLGSAADVKVGQLAVAIGSLVGEGGHPSVSLGVVSALGRTVERRSPHSALFGMIQTDAAVLPGFSGGALVDRTGAVIGVTTVVAPEGGMKKHADDLSALGLAIPIDTARSVANELIVTGEVAPAWLGVEGSDLDQATAGQLGVTGGALVSRVVEGSPADKAGIRPGDIIVSLDGTEVASMSTLVAVLRADQVGQKVQIRYLRDGRQGQKMATLAKQP